MHEDIRRQSSGFDLIIERLLVVLLVFMPLAFGARSAWSEQVVIAVSGAIAICFLLKLIFRRDQTFVWTWAYIPIVIFLALTVFQLISFPAKLISEISPDTAALKTELLGDLPNAESLLSSMSLSFYKNATRHDLRLLLALAATFVVVVNVFRQPQQIKRLLKNISIIAAIVALIALIQDVFGNGMIYWCVYATGDCRSGPFVNRNHFGQFMNLSIGAAVGWFCIRAHEEFAGRRLKLSAIMEYIMSPSAKPMWYFVLIISLCATAVFASLTRGGMISMLVAASFMLLLLARQTHLRGGGWVMVVAAMLAFVCILFIGFDAVYERLATLKTFAGYEYRWQIVKDLQACFTRFPVFGTGSGTHAVIYPMFQNISSTLLFTHVENEYAELFEECGIIGLLAFAGFGIIIFLSFVKIIRSKKIAVHWAAYGLGMGLLAILIHSLSDYGQHVPANAFLSCIFCALLVGLAGRSVDPDNDSQPGGRFLRSGKVRLLALIGVSAVFVWSLTGANNARLAQAQWKKVREVEKDLIAKNWKGTESEYADLISYAAAATEYEPDNIEYLYSLGVCRWYSISKMQELEADEITGSEKTSGEVKNIIALLNRARLSCPTYGPAHSVAGQLERFVFNDDRGSEKIRKGYRLAPNDPIACFIAGQLDVLEGRVDDSVEKFEKAVKLQGSLFREIADIYIEYLSLPHLAISAAGESISRLNYVTQVLEDMQYSDLAEQTRRKVKEILEEKCSQPDAPAVYLVSLGDFYRREGDTRGAIKCYRRALELNYAQVTWRLTLARLLAEAGQVQQAVDEAKICLHLRSRHKAAEALLGELSVLPGGVNE